MCYSAPDFHNNRQRLPREIKRSEIIQRSSSQFMSSETRVKTKQKGKEDCKKSTQTDLGNLVKLSKQFVEHDDELLGGTVAGQSSEAHNVGVENTERKNTLSKKTCHNLGSSMPRKSKLLGIQETCEGWKYSSNVAQKYARSLAHLSWGSFADHTFYWFGWRSLVRSHFQISPHMFNQILDSGWATQGQSRSCHKALPFVVLAV